jgi:selenocysteine lyase/cysteine desulfurase
VIPGLAEHYKRFGVAERLLLTGHSHQAWPDVALEGVTEAFADAAELADTKWERAFAKAERLRHGYRALIGDLAAEIALGANTHELVVRFLSALPRHHTPRLVTTDGEFHTLRRQLGRFAEVGVEVVRVAARPVEDLCERLAEQVDRRTDAVLVSAVLFEDARIVPGLDELARTCADRGVELLIDAYHALGAVPFQAPPTAWIVGGGYKYLQLGEGNCFLRVPEHAWDWRPVITGWYAEFSLLEGDAGGDARIPFARGGEAFAGATYDPTSHYRAARVLDFFAEQGLSAKVLRESYQQQLRVLADAFDRLGALPDVIDRDRETPLERFGGFLALGTPRAAELQAELVKRGVLTDHRGHFLRFGPAPYLSDTQLQDAMSALGHVLSR